jgi:hypothetical protein
LLVRIGETVSTSRNKLGDSFLATLEQLLVIDGFIIAERGARVEGRVVEATPSHLSVELVRLSTADGQRVQIRTQPYKKDGTGSTGGDLAKVGTGTAVITSARSSEIPVESRLSFKVQQPVTITEKLE